MNNEIWTLNTIEFSDGLISLHHTRKGAEEKRLLLENILKEIKGVDAVSPYYISLRLIEK